MRENEKRYKEDRWMDTTRNKASDRRQSIILHRKLLKQVRQDRRSGADRRGRNEKKIKSVYIVE